MIENNKIKIFCFTGLIITLSLFLIPRNYDVPQFKERPETKYWDLNTGSKIGYTLIESKQKENKNPIIYLHGGPGGIIKKETIEMLKPLSEKGYDLYFYDQIGSGHSERLEKIEAYTVDRHQKDLDEIITKIGSKKVILLAHSWGSMLAVNYLTKNNSKIEKMILTGPGPILPINNKLSKVKPPDSLNLKTPKYSNKEGNEKAYNLRSKLILKWAYLFNEKLGSDQEVDAFFTHLNTELNRSTTCDGVERKSYGGGGYYAHIMTVQSFNEVKNEKQTLKEIETPVLILKGQCDNQKWGFTKEYLDLLSNSKLEVIENSGHHWTENDQNKYLERIINFLALKKKG